MNILILIKKYSILIGVALISIMYAIISALRLDKAKTQRDLAEGEAKAVRKAVKAQQESDKETTSEYIELDERRKNRTHRDLD